MCSFHVCIDCDKAHTHTIVRSKFIHMHDFIQIHDHKNVAHRRKREGEKQTFVSCKRNTFATVHPVVELVLVMFIYKHKYEKKKKTTNRQLEGQQISLGYNPREITTLFQSSIVTVVNKTGTNFSLSTQFDYLNFRFVSYARTSTECCGVRFVRLWFCSSETTTSTKTIT